MLGSRPRHRVGPPAQARLLLRLAPAARVLGPRMRHCAGAGRSGRGASAARGLSAERWATIRDLAATNPLSHPLPFSMGAMEFPLPPPPHLVEIYASVFQALAGDPSQPKTLMRLMPREHGKSEGVSHVIPSWAALNDPNIRILIMSETAQQAEGKLAECSETIGRLAP